MNISRLTPAFAALLLAAAPAWAVYKCKGPDGRYVYQDSLCAGDGKEIDATPASGDGKPEWEKRLDESNRKAEAESKKRLAEYEKEKAAREQQEAEWKRTQAEYEAWSARQDTAAREKADQRRKKLAASGVPCEESNMPEMPSIGMKEATFLDCTWVGRGSSEAVNETVTAGGTTRQYVYKRAHTNNRYYIYTRNGVVSAIQR